MKISYKSLLLGLICTSSAIGMDIPESPIRSAATHKTMEKNHSHGQSSDELDQQTKAKKLWDYILKNLLPQYPDSEIDTITTNISNEGNEQFFDKLEELKYLYNNVKNEKNQWTNSFYFLICSFKNVDMLNTLLSNCPSELLTSTLSRKITGFELAGLSCKSKPVEQKKALSQWLNQPDSLDCWYDTDAPDAICSARQKGQICPLTLEHKFTHTGIHITPKVSEIEINKNSSLIKNLNKPFNPKKFGEEQSPPLSLGCLENKDLFSKWGPFPQSQNMPIKMPFTDYRLPLELSQFEEAVQKVADYWHSINPEADYYFCYLSSSQSNVPPGKYQRRGHLHSDGFQSSWITPELYSDFSFIVSNVAPTEFYLQAVDVSHLDPSRHNYYNYISQKVTIKADRSQKPFEIMMMDSYTLHKAIKNETPNEIQRTFLRFIFSTARWDRKGNGHNPMFEYNWPMIERNMMDQLI